MADDESRLERMEQMLDERGVRVGRLRLAAGRSGIAVGFPRDPMLHVAWGALAALGVAAALVRRRRS
jgi:MYXO-CTERM domain-containing protein